MEAAPGLGTPEGQTHRQRSKVQRGQQALSTHVNCHVSQLHEHGIWPRRLQQRLEGAGVDGKAAHQQPPCVGGRIELRVCCGGRCLQQEWVGSSKGRVSMDCACKG